MKFVATDLRLHFDEAGKAEITLTTRLSRQEALIGAGEIKKVIENDKLLSVEIKQHREKRSLDSNGYLWTLCQKIAEVINSTKEEVYKKFIRDVGQFEILPIREEAVDHWIAVWSSRGLGWYAEVIDDSKIPGYKKVISYYGSSVYDTKAMSVLLDEIVTQAKELEIETLPPAEIASLKNLWDKSK
jgi:hypothetical protein